MEGFFGPTSLKLVNPGLALRPKCGKCGLYKLCQSGKMPVAGKGKRKILIVGEAPGKDEDRYNRPFVGKTGQELQRILRLLGADLFRDCWVTNAIRCRPKNNRTPKAKEIEFCRPYLTQALEELQPNVVIPLGAVAVKSVIGGIWKEDTGGIMRWAGYKIPCIKPNIWICPTFHPSFVVRQQNNPVVERMWKEHLLAAISVTDKPHKTNPDYESRLRVIVSPTEAVKQLAYFEDRDFAWDLETNMLKPDSTKAEIISCSVSDGNISIAYPWVRETAQATKKLLLSDAPKLGFNDKFEHRWIKNKLGIEVNNWKWDGMIVAHILNNTSGVTSLKFQAFVRYGVGPYDAEVKPYLESQEKGGNTLNRIRECDLLTLLKYNAMDSLLEYMVCTDQMKEVRG